jgi:hypothetical protein
MFQRALLASTVSLTMAMSSLSIQAETPQAKKVSAPVQSVAKPLTKPLTNASGASEQKVQITPKTTTNAAPQGVQLKTPSLSKTPVQKTQVQQTSETKPASTVTQNKAGMVETKSIKAIQPDASVSLSAQDKKALTAPQTPQKQPVPKTTESSKTLSQTTPSAMKATSVKPAASNPQVPKSQNAQIPSVTKSEPLKPKASVIVAPAKSGVAGAAANITAPKSLKESEAKTSSFKTVPTKTSPSKPSLTPASTGTVKAVTTPAATIPSVTTSNQSSSFKPSKNESVKKEPAKKATVLVSPTPVVTEESTLPKVSDLLHQVEFDISAYPESKTLSGKLTHSDQVVQILNGTKNLLVHMEAIRRGSLDFSATEKQALAQKIHARYFASENDVTKFFDNGYAQMTVLNNKSGLFFLRKANDKLANQFTSLAYALAQADADVNIERANPANMTFRKLDVTYKMTDAVARDAQSHQPGFWPSFTLAMEKLGTIPAFTSFAYKDFSDSYVPFPNDGVLGQGGKVKVVTSESTATDASGKSVAAGCEPAISTGQDISVDLTKAFKMMPLRLGLLNPMDKIYFFQTAQPSQYRVLAINASRQVLADFISPQAPYIIEDLDGDGTDELVIRQYLKDKKEPVKVYRYSSFCGFQQDKTVAGYFR